MTRNDARQRLAWTRSGRDDVATTRAGVRLRITSSTTRKRTRRVLATPPRGPDAVAWSWDGHTNRELTRARAEALGRVLEETDGYAELYR